MYKYLCDHEVFFAFPQLLSMMMVYHQSVKWVLFGSLDMCMGLFGTQGKTGMMDTTHRRDMGCMKGRVRLVGRLLAAASRTSLDTGLNYPDLASISLPLDSHYSV